VVLLFLLTSESPYLNLPLEPAQGSCEEQKHRNHTRKTLCCASLGSIYWKFYP